MLKPMLKIEHLTKTYGGKPAVQDPCLHIRPGELCAFIGHNGAGKTTTLKCCCGIQQFDAGEIYVDGISVRDDPLECKRRLAYPINDEEEGVYTVINFTSEPSFPAELDRVYKITEGVMRSLIIAHEE